MARGTILFPAHQISDSPPRGVGLCMSAVVDILRADHANLAKLLDFIALQAQLASAGGQADLEALIEAAEYLGDYPVHFHHPLENAI